MFVGVTFLAIRLHVHYVDAGNVSDLVGYPQDKPIPTVIAQIGATVFGGNNNLPFYFVQFITAIILVLAANTAFNGFPVLASILAQDRYMPRQLHTRGDRLVFSNGILLLAGFAGLLIWASHANSTTLIQLYIVGVFVSFTCSQAGMVRHWNRLLRSGDLSSGQRRQTLRRRGISAFAFVMTGTVLVVVLITKFLHGAWIAVVAMVFLYFLMRGIRRHYDLVSEELVAESDSDLALPSRVHAIILVSKLHKPTLRAIAYARAARPTTIEALTGRVEPHEAERLSADWERRGIPVPLKVLDSPYREVTRPVVSYIKEIHRQSPRDLVTVYIPEYVVGHWWEQVLHNQSALRLKSRLLFTPGVMVASVPWQLNSSQASPNAAGRPEPTAKSS